MCNLLPRSYKKSLPMTSPAADSQSLVVACPLHDSLKRPILEQSRLRGSGVSKHMRDPGLSQWKLPEKYGENLLQYPTSTSMVFMPPKKARKRVSKPEAAMAGSSTLSKMSESSSSSASVVRVMSSRVSLLVSPVHLPRMTSAQTIISVNCP